MSKCALRWTISKAWYDGKRHLDVVDNIILGVEKQDMITLDAIQLIITSDLHF